jgi:hypothetical protein
MNKKKGFAKILRIILYLSFASYLFLIGYSLYQAIFGYDVYTWILPQYVRTIYGWGAFLEVLTWTAIQMCFIPVLPICFLFQVGYFFIGRKEGLKRRRQSENDFNDNKNMSKCQIK